MTLFFSLLPIYIFGNLHCAGMCGPLVMLLARHRYRYLYFVGRLASFTLAGLVSAELGMLFFSFLARYHISALFSLIFGAVLFVLGICLILRIPYPGSRWLSKRSAPLSMWLGKWVAKDSPYATFAFGFCTILLPCGQTLVVFAACALDAQPLTGLFNGFAFALLTSPSLIGALTAASWLKSLRKSHHLLIGLATLAIASLTLLRAFASLEVIPHCVLNPNSPPTTHIVLY